MAETREEMLLRTSEVYRRLRAPVSAERPAPAIELLRDVAPPDTARARPQEPVEEAEAEPPTPALPPPGPSFVRRMLTRRLDLREIVLLVFAVVILWLARG